MILYVCYGTHMPDRHPCGAAAKALRDAGHDPDVRKSYGWKVLPGFMNFSEGRREAKRRTGKTDVPLLILDDDTTVAGTQAIVDWAKAHPAANA